MAQINGKPAPEADGQTVAELLEGMGYDRARVACELNGEILPRAEYDAYRLAAADALEVVRFVGGG